jgi:hypothetical protein
MSRFFSTLFAVTAFALFGQPAAFSQDVIIKVDGDTSKTITISKKKSDDANKNVPFKGDRPAVDVAILLDTSSSMNGLISQAQTQLWKIVQEFAEAEKQGQTPLLRVSLFEYGNSGLPATEGYIRQVVQLTTDLDTVSEGLFGLTTNGGDEYCGMVIDEALKRLDWSKEPNSYKAIFIAGNEPFTQGSVAYETTCKKAIESGVVVNTIHCGDYQKGVSGKWKHGADLAEGEYLNIDQDHKPIHIKCPQDKIIIELNAKLNKTYLWYGSDQTRSRFSDNQIAQDNNSSSVGGFASRALTKSGKAYNNVGRDLVDSLEADAEILEKVPAKQLPAEMQAMSGEERTAHLKKMADQRAKIKKEMAQLNQQRSEFVAKERKKMAMAGGEKTLGEVMVDAVRKQLTKAGFETSGAEIKSEK